KTSYFWTLKRWNELKEAQQKEKDEKRKGSAAPMRPRSFGTVGAVALDRNGDLAAGTSTGGMTGKRPGRLGDTPIIGAGTYADDEGGAASATGHGEMIIRVAMSKVAVDAMRGGARAAEAAKRAVEALSRVNGEAGVAVVD